MLLRAKSRTGSRPRSLCSASRLQPSAILGWPPRDHDPLRAGGIAMTGRSGPFQRGWWRRYRSTGSAIGRGTAARSASQISHREMSFPSNALAPTLLARVVCPRPGTAAHNATRVPVTCSLIKLSLSAKPSIPSRRTSISATSGHNCTSPNRTAAIGQLHENGSITGHTTTSQRNSCDTLGAQTHASASSRPPHSAHDMSLIPREVKPDRPAPTIPRRRHSGYATPASQTWSLSNIEA